MLRQKLSPLDFSWDKLWRIMAMASGTKINNMVTANIQYLIIFDLDFTEEKVGKLYIFLNIISSAIQWYKNEMRPPNSRRGHHILNVSGPYCDKNASFVTFLIDMDWAFNLLAPIT